MRDAGKVDEKVVLVDDMFKEYPELVANNAIWDNRLENGNPFSWEHMIPIPQVDELESAEVETPLDGTLFRVYDSKRQFIGIYEYRREEVRWKPKKIFLGGE